IVKIRIARSVFMCLSSENYLFPLGMTAAGLRLNRPAIPTTSNRISMTPKAVIVVQRAVEMPSPNRRSSVGAKFKRLSQSSLKFKKAARTPTSEPPAIYPEQSRTPGLDSDFSALGGLTRSTIHRITPPTKIGKDVWIGK